MVLQWIFFFKVMISVNEDAKGLLVYYKRSCLISFGDGILVLINLVHGVCKYHHCLFLQGIMGDTYSASSFFHCLFLLVIMGDTDSASRFFLCNICQLLCIITDSSKRHFQKVVGVHRVEFT